VIITLTWAEVLLAAQVGCMRNVQCLENEWHDRSGDPTNTWTRNIEGTCGEMAVAKWLNVYWSGNVGDLNAADVGDLEVKTNTSRRWDDLMIQRENRTDRNYVSVLSFLPRFKICGWITGAEGKQDKYWREGKPGQPCYFVPRSDLHPLTTLPLPWWHEGTPT